MNTLKRKMWQLLTEHFIFYKVYGDIFKYWFFFFFFFSKIIIVIQDFISVSKSMLICPVCQVPDVRIGYMDMSGTV